MIYPIVMYGDPVLRKIASEVPPGTEVTTLVADLFETMKSASGIGLAAPQIGKPLRVFVVDATSMDEEEDDEDLGDFRLAFINPVVVETKGEPWAFEEGCLSIPNIRENVLRPETVTLRYFTEDWQPKEEVFGGMKARIIQHEYDHIEGKLFIDYLSPLKKRMLKGKLADISKGNVDTEYRILAPLKK